MNVWHVPLNLNSRTGSARLIGNMMMLIISQLKPNTCQHAFAFWNVCDESNIEQYSCTQCGRVLMQHAEDVAIAQPESAADFLKAALKHQEDRAVTYDKPQGERSIEKVVAMFNQLKGTNLSATDGWEFMILLKMVRANQGDFKSDNYEDLVAYASLAGEQAVIDFKKAA